MIPFGKKLKHIWQQPHKFPRGFLRFLIFGKKLYWLYQTKCNMSANEGKYFVWPTELTDRLIKCRQKHSHLFSGRRHSASRAWTEVIKELKLEGLVSIGQCRKKWENTFKKYKTLQSLPHEERIAKSPSWPHYSLMDELFGGEEHEPIIIFESCSLPAPSSPIAPVRKTSPSPSPSSPSPASPSPASCPPPSPSRVTQLLDSRSSPYHEEHSYTRPLRRRRLAEKEVFHGIKRVCSLLERSIEVHERQGERFLALFEQLVNKNT
ncbi:uncharacterized protein LOC124158527 [Ischnura elegans]|uniref:uncharacterized protein LOC124158527 n=1 Tax=Ischnura elegans TaxID=197161 RepID=UPI001ED8B170|nr:uncharacterized protein LOC124158527 [Ischnura elegans]